MHTKYMLTTDAIRCAPTIRNVSNIKGTKFDKFCECGIKPVQLNIQRECHDVHLDQSKTKFKQRETLFVQREAKKPNITAMIIETKKLRRKFYRNRRKQ